MGIQDRDYWRDRYNHRSRAGDADPTHWRQDELYASGKPAPVHPPEQLLMAVTIVFAVAAAAFFGFNYLSERKRQQLQVSMQDAQSRAIAQAREQALQRAQLLHQQTKQQEARRQLQHMQPQVQQQQMHSARQQALDAQSRKEVAWQKFYQPAPHCLQDATVECANAFIRAKRQFEATYQEGKR